MDFATWNKDEILNLFIKTLEQDIHGIEENMKAAREEATHEESKPENEYDTRALETGYLVKAQSKRLLDAKESLGAFKHITLKPFTKNDKIQATALIQIEHQGKLQFLFFMPSGGGTTIQYHNQKIQVITPVSPLGESLLGLKVDDVATVEHGDDVIEFEIQDIK